MHKPRIIAPQPILDLNSTRLNTTTARVTTTPGAALHVCLDTANLGGNLEAFISRCNTYSAASIPVNKYCSMGVALTPLNTIKNWEDKPIAIEYFIACTMPKISDEYLTSIFIQPFIGVFDNATVGNNWHANNTITNYALLPQGGSFQSDYICDQILLKDITSGGWNDSNPIGIGFLVCDAGSGQINGAIDYTISARYAHRSIETHHLS